MRVEVIGEHQVDKGENVEGKGLWMKPWGEPT